MSRLGRLIRSLASPVSKSGESGTGESTAGDTRRRFEWSKRRGRRAGRGTQVEKQSIDRRAEAYASIESAAADEGGVRKPYDPLFLRDIAANAVAQAYIDTLSQDVAAAKWSLRPRNENADVDESAIADAEERVRDLHPELPWRDVLEETTRILLELGDATWVKHYFADSDELAEFLVVDSATMFKRTNRYGITDGYVQASRRSQQVETEFDSDEVVWFSWSLRPERHYGQGPLEKAKSEVELLGELQEKERLDLVAGSPPGVLSPNYDDEFGGTVPDEDWDSFVDQMILDEGERHRVGYSKIPVEFEPLTSSYQELQVLERSRYWVTVLGAVFKCNPSYVGFDFENVNRATDESQQEAYAQRGFRVTLRQLEESINRGLIWPEINDSLRFEFHREQTVDERKTKAELVERQAQAGKEMADALDDSDATVNYRDGEILVDDGEITPSDDDAGGGGLFGMSTGTLARKDIPDSVLDEISTDRFIPPKGAADAARRALELIDEHGRDEASGGTQEGVVRARQIVEHYENDDPLIGTNEDGVPYVREIANFHRRHRAQGNHEYDDDEYDARHADPGWFADKLWGGDPGFEWADALEERLTEVEESDALPDPTDADGDSGNSDGGDTDTNPVVAELSDDEITEYQRHLIDAHRTQVQPATLEDIEKRAWTRDDTVPEYVREAVENVIDRGAIFDRFETVPGTLRETVEDILRDSLTQPEGWSLDSITDRMSDAFPGVDEDDLETVARTETTSVLNRAREDGYESRPDADQYRYYWQGPGDSRTTDLCEDLKIATGQESGTTDTPFDSVPGEPVDIDTLVRLEREASDHHFPDLQFRRHTPHINCRHTFVRDAGADIEVDVDVPDAEVFNSTAKACGCGDPADYDAVVDRVAKYVTGRTEKERRIERALGESIVQVLRSALSSNDGKAKPAWETVCDRLERSPSFDYSTKRPLSRKTFYRYMRRHEDSVEDVR